MHDDTCHDLLEALSDYVDGAAADVCAAVERHLATCPDCRVVVDTLRGTIALYRRLPRPDLPDDARERLYRVLDLPPAPG